MCLNVDGGPDWKYITTFVAMGKQWKESDLDVCLLSTYAPRQRKFNPIEHQWAGCSRDLSGAVLPSEEKAHLNRDI